MSSAIALRRCAVVGLPEPITREEYTHAESEIEMALSSAPGAIAVYRIGGISAPGISDLDLVAVIDGPFPVRGVWPALSARTRAIAMHAPFAVDPSTFTNHRWFARLQPLELLWGQPVAVQEPPQVEYGERMLGTEGLIVGLLKLCKQLLVGRIKVRALLCGLHALRHSLELAQLTEVETPDAWRMIKEVDAIRRSWFDEGLAGAGERAERIRRLACAAQPAIFGALAQIAPDPHTGGSSPEPRRLGSPWSNVELVPDCREAPAGATVQASWVAPLSSRSRRAGELLWRSRHRRVPIASGALATLNRPRNQAIADLYEERAHIVSRYTGLLSNSPGAWSGIGFAQSFLPHR